MNETLFRPLPDGLTELAPGPALSAALALVDRSACTGFQLLEVMRARQRQVCWEQAQLLADLHELAHTPQPAAEARPRRGPGRRVAEEVSLALSVTRQAAGQDLALAFSLFNGFEPVYAALAAGRIDVPKTKMLLREVGLLDVERAAGVIDTILSTVDLRSYGEIQDSVRRLVLTIDPALVRRKQQTATGRRRVQHIEHADGTASIIGRCLPRDAVAAALDHLDQLTTAAKQGNRDSAGTGPVPLDAEERTADQLRADIFVALLRGDPAGATTADKFAGVGADRGRVKCSPERRKGNADQDHRSSRRAGRVRGGRRRHRSAARAQDGAVAGPVAPDREKSAG